MNKVVISLLALCLLFSFSAFSANKKHKKKIRKSPKQTKVVAKDTAKKMKSKKVKNEYALED